VEQEFQGTQTINRATQLLTLVLEAERPRGLTELADEAALPKSTASRLLGALERRGLIQQRGRRGRFEPGPVLRRFAHRGQLVELAHPHLEALSEASEVGARFERGDYFVPERVLWLAQRPTAATRAAAERAANHLGLPLEVREVGDEALERQLASLLN